MVCSLGPKEGPNCSSLAALKNAHDGATSRVQVAQVLQDSSMVWPRRVKGPGTP